MTAPRAIPKPHLTEAQFQRAVIDLLHLHHWRVAHFSRGQSAKGRWMTLAQADAAGFPDLLCVRGHRLLALELKSDRGRTSETQRDWLNALAHVAGVEAHVVRPSDWDQLEEIVK